MKVLVTGGAGFIGSHLVNKLIKEGCAVIVLDRLLSSKKEYLDKIKKNKLTLIEADITDSRQLKKSYFANVSWVFHLAGLSDIKTSVSHPLDYHKVNVNGTLNLLEICRSCRIKKFIYTASASCYGRAPVIPTLETAPVNLDSPYALTKYLGEAYALHYSQVYHLPVVSLRLFNVYGPSANSDQVYGPIITVFILRKLAGKPYVIFGNGEQKRDFVYISDVVNAFILAARLKCINEVFNVGTSRSYSINQLVKLLEGRAIYQDQERQTEVYTCADISKIKKMLGWHPEVSFQEGIKNTIKSISNING